MAPTISFSSYQHVMTTFVAAVLSECQLDILVEDITKNLPSTSTVKHFLHQTATEIMVAIRHKS